MRGKRLPVRARLFYTMAQPYRRDLFRRILSSAAAVAVVLLGLATAADASQAAPAQQPAPPAQQPAPPAQQPAPPAAAPAQAPPTQGAPPTEPPAATAPPNAAKPADPNAADPNDRIFGVIPNYNTIEGKTTIAPPITSKQSFKIAAQGSFDPMVYPMFGFIAGVAQLQNSPESYGKGWEGYGKRYAVAFADNTVCSLVTTGLLPSLLKQDPRYYQGHATGFFHRLAYAASRSVVTKSRSGEPQFNLSEVGGTLIVANVSNLYYPSEEKNVPDTLQRWGTQAMWDTLANELKEFWPDIRHKLHSN
jgi:hypothetical protein